MKMKINIVLAALAFVAWGCSSDNDDVITKGIAEGTDARPTWQIPNYDNYEQTMMVEVTLQDPLQTYASAADLMCATIGGEVRGVATPEQVDGKWRFTLIVASNKVGASVDLSYYCDHLHRIFTTSWTTFDAATVPIGTGGIYQPEFVK
ncbi:MAG: hypothetical protein IJ635_08075 [Bacteroidaceae bacterium]|nr:hypothetical protein [Prevotella sp.]MBQ9665549.1 hypothetical protein [Bacteroidaceae bacterium]MBR1521180.1 hypothetical protein [Bacteroidaceae bacterium]